MSSERPGALSLVLVPAVLTLVVTILRLVGELQGWNDEFFSKQPGQEGQHGWVGITWLVPVFGLWFGFRLRRLWGEPERLGSAFLKMVAAIGVVAGGMYGLVTAGLVTLPSEEQPGEAMGMGYVMGLVIIGLVIGLSAWWRLGGVLLLYALLARIPVIVITYFAANNGWDTHHVALPPGMPAKEGNELVMFLSLPQLTVWPMFTVLVGGLFGLIAAALTPRVKG